MLLQLRLVKMLIVLQLPERQSLRPVNYDQISVKL